MAGQMVMDYSTNVQFAGVCYPLRPMEYVNVKIYALNLHLQEWMCKMKVKFAYSEIAKRIEPKGQSISLSQGG